MALLLNLLYKANAPYPKQLLYARALMFVCVLGGFAASASLCQAAPL